jgi:hypothetical protein
MAVVTADHRKEYTHELNKEVRSISGGYTLEREERIEKGGREILYAVGNAVADSSCCGFWGCRFAVVPGYVLKWHDRIDDQRNPVSMVEPIADERLKREISQTLRDKENVSQIRFW